ncbi:hypothetical protein KR074_006135, partial [Drosophila pseudoananassae]
MATEAVQEELRCFVATSRKRLHSILGRMSWTQEAVRRVHKTDTEPVEHAAQLPVSCFTYPAFSLQLNAKDMRKILDKVVPCTSTFDSIQAVLDPRQRLLIYQHVIEHTGRHQGFQDNAAFSELVAGTKREQMKQRRYRKSKPTLNEELHQLVELQMQALERQCVQPFEKNSTGKKIHNQEGKKHERSDRRDRKSKRRHR